MQKNGMAELDDAAKRWSRFGAYYAMFPVDFASEVINKYSSEGDFVLDPFAGRGTSPYMAAALGRAGIGVEINPVGWVYGKTKIAPAEKNKVCRRLDEICAQAKRFRGEADKLPPFFRACFCHEVRCFLLAAKSSLNWRRSSTDVTLMSVINLHLHGKSGEGMSNQMRQIKSMSPEYSMRWWRKHGMFEPPEISPGDFLRKKIEWRYAKGVPAFSNNTRLYLGDSLDVLRRISRDEKKEKDKVSLLFTSPPYWSLVNYHTDQWLRLWLLGGPDSPRSLGGKNRGRFLSQKEYYALLHGVFSQCARLMKKKSIVYVRTDIREFTSDVTKNILRQCFPKHRMQLKKSYAEKTQSRLFCNVPSVIKPGEIDVILTPA